MSNGEKKTGRNILAVVAGVIAALIIMIPMIIVAGFMVFSDARLPRSQELFSDLIMVFGIAAGSFAGGFITSAISMNKRYYPAFFTGLILILLYLILLNFNFSNLTFAENLTIPVIILFINLGAYLFIKKKKAKTKNGTFPPDTPS